MKNEIFEKLVKEAKYAQNSFSTNLLYMVHGKQEMAYQLGAITHEQYWILNDMTVKFMNTDKEYIRRKK